jgi:hypothetical protein
MIFLYATFMLAAATPAPATKSYAVIVASSRALAAEVKPLEYADDDGARWAELFDRIADHVELLTVLDPEAQRIYPALAQRASKPDRATLDDTLSRTFARITRDKKSGARVVLYFVMVGHGELGPGGEGFVSLLDSPFTRSDLYREVLAKSPATTNHVIIDACNSYFLVNKRGGALDDAGPSRAELLKRYVSQEELAQYPNTGVLLSTSSAKESHEWAGYRAGVFSHEVRSALLGAADANGDGVVEYAEVHGFIAAANLGVEDPRARVEMYAVPPAIDMRVPIVELGNARFPGWLSIPAGRAVRLYLEDDRGVRSADMHLTGEVATHVGFLSRRRHFVRTPDGLEAGIDPEAGAVITFDPSKFEARTIAARGSISDTFQNKLFAEAFGPAFLRGFAAANGYAPASEPSQRWSPAAELDLRENSAGSNIHVWSMFGGAAALAVGSVVSAFRARSIESDFRTHVGSDGTVTGISRADAESMQRDARTWAWARNGLAAGSAAALAAGVAFWFFDRDGTSPVVAPIEDGATFGLTGQF